MCAQDNHQKTSPRFIMIALCLAGISVFIMLISQPLGGQHPIMGIAAILMVITGAFFGALQVVFSLLDWFVWQHRKG